MVVGLPLSWVLSTWLNDEEKIAPALIPFVAEWEAGMQSAGVDYHEDFDDIRHIKLANFFLDNVGSSSRFNHMILIENDLFNLGPFTVKATVYHELGHYVFDLEHGSCAIMKPKCSSEQDYAEHWDDYKREYLQLCNARLTSLPN